MRRRGTRAARGPDPEAERAPPSGQPTTEPTGVLVGERCGGGSTGGNGGGLGFFIWNSYNGGNYEAIVIGMISIGICGYISSSLLRTFGGYLTPWLAKR